MTYPENRKKAAGGYPEEQGMGYETVGLKTHLEELQTMPNYYALREQKRPSPQLRPFGQQIAPMGAFEVQAVWAVGRGGLYLCLKGGGV